MKFSPKENNILFVLAVVFGLYDFFSIPFNSFLITLVFAVVLYGFTKSPFFIAFVFLVPQFIKLINMLLGIREKMTDTPQNISSRLNSIKGKYSQGVNLNPETPTKEYFQDAKSVSDRVEKVMKDNAIKKPSEVSGLVDISQPSGVYPIEGTPSYPNFMETTMGGVEVNENTRIPTIAESSIPALGTIQHNVLDRPYISTYDDISVSTALKRTTNDIPLLTASNLKGDDMTH
jgi:hypothetical protein